MAKVLQTVLVSRATAPTLKEAERIARQHADRIYTSRRTKNYWRFRQRPPGCFAGGYKSEKIRKGKVVLIYATLKKSATQRRICR
jgi:hypothetical protein